MIKYLEVTKSELRRKLLAYFFTNPQSHFYLREIASILDEDPSNLSKEFIKLEKEGIFLAEIRGNQKYFSLNIKYPLYKELKSIIFKTIGVEGRVKDALQKISGIKFAFIYGSFAKNTQDHRSDIDLLIIGKINEDQLIKKISEIENFLDREINYSYFSKNDWDKTKKDKDSFIIGILEKPKVMLIGDENKL